MIYCNLLKTSPTENKDTGAPLYPAQGSSSQRSSRRLSPEVSSNFAQRHPYWAHSDPRSGHPSSSSSLIVKKYYTILF